MRGAIIQINTAPAGGLPKYAIPEAAATPLGLEGDRQAHPEFHGGPRQAILLIAAENIEALRQDGYSVFYGALGENLTTRGLDFKQIRVGQRFRAGEAILEITKIRQPCQQLEPYGAGIRKAVFDSECKAGNPESLRWGVSGFYASVQKTGMIRTNDIIELLDQVV